jgi:hypothetical protein
MGEKEEDDIMLHVKQADQMTGGFIDPDKMVGGVSIVEWAIKINNVDLCLIMVFTCILHYDVFLGSIEE